MSGRADATLPADKKGRIDFEGYEITEGVCGNNTVKYPYESKIL